MSFSSSPLSSPALAHAVAAVHSPLTPARHSDSTLSPPVDVQQLEQPANVARPRRLSVSDHALLTRALSNAFSFDGSRSRPSSAEAQRRAKTRYNVPTVGAGTMKDTHATEVFALAYSADSAQLAAGCGDGSIRLFANAPGQSHLSLQRVAHHASDRDHLPATCVRYNPVKAGDDARVLLAAYADGTVSQWRIGGPATEAKCARNTVTPGDSAGANSIYAVAYQADGKSFATAGRDHIVRLFDETTGALVRECDNVGSHGHTNRIYALKYHPSDANMLLSAGWDNSIQFCQLDMREKQTYQLWSRIGGGCCAVGCNSHSVFIVLSLFISLQGTRALATRRAASSVRTCAAMRWISTRWAQRF